MARRADSKTGLRLELEGQITLQRLGDAIDAWTDFLREVGRDVAGRGGRDAVRYVVTEAKGGSLTLGVRPQAAKRNVPAAVIPRIATTVTAGIRSLDRSAKRPRVLQRYCSGEAARSRVAHRPRNANGQD